MSSQTIEHDGTWWAQASDGSWRRWSHVFGDWEPTDGPPRELGEPASDHGTGALHVLTMSEELTPKASPTGWIGDYAATLVRLTLPGLLLGLAIPVAFLLSLVFLFLSDGGLLPPPDNVKAILIWSGVTGAFVAGAMGALRHLPDQHRLPPSARRGLAAVLGVTGIAVGWLATGSRWSGSTASKAVTLAMVLLLGMAIDALHRRGALAWLRPARTARSSAFTGPG